MECPPRKNNADTNGCAYLMETDTAVKFKLEQQLRDQNTKLAFIEQYSSDKTKRLVETAIYRVSKTQNFCQ